jgi:hypothetical protein
MSNIEQLENGFYPAATFKQGAKVRIKYTGQIVDLKRVSESGISVVSFRAGGECFISNKFLEPVFTLH